jgi:hypothetical protein
MICHFKEGGPEPGMQGNKAAQLWVTDIAGEAPTDCDDDLESVLMFGHIHFWQPNPNFIPEQDTFAKVTGDFALSRKGPTDGESDGEIDYFDSMMTIRAWQVIG